MQQHSIHTEAFAQHLSSRVKMSAEEMTSVLAYFKTAHFAKKQNLQEYGTICKSHYFVLKGCLRMFFVDEKGIEKTTQFAIENWWITDYLAFQAPDTSGFSIQAVEPTDVLMIDLPGQEELYVKYPQMERYFRIIYQKAYAASQKRLMLLYDFSKEELYLNFSKSFPGFIQRIPQYLLASYLGFTPEYLSEIRKKNLS